MLYLFVGLNLHISRDFPGNYGLTSRFRRLNLQICFYLKINLSLFDFFIFLCRRGLTPILTCELQACRPASPPFQEENRMFTFLLSLFNYRRFYSQNLTLFHLCCRFQSLLFPRECRRSDAARALPSRRSHRPWHPAPRSSDQHAEPRRSSVRRHHQQPHASRLHWWKGLRQDLGHQSARQQESCVPTWLSGNQMISHFKMEKLSRVCLTLHLFQDVQP